MTVYALTAVGLTVHPRPMPSPVFGKGPQQVLASQSFSNDAPVASFTHLHQHQVLTPSALTAGPPLFGAPLSNTALRSALLLHARELPTPGVKQKKRKPNE